MFIYHSFLVHSSADGHLGCFHVQLLKTCILSYVKRITSSGSMHETGCLGLVHWNDPEGWDGEGGGKREGFQDGEHMYTRGRVMSMYGKTTTIL